MNATPSVWLCKFGTTLAVTLAICCIVPRMFDNIPIFPLINSERGHVRILNHYFQSPTPTIALAGSSLTERLKESYFERRDIRNVGLGGGSPLTGLTVLAETTRKRPPIIAIETNIMLRGVDRALVREFHDVDQPVAAFAPLRSLLAFHQMRLDGPAPAFDPKRCEDVFRTPPSPSLIGIDDTASVTAAFDNPALDDQVQSDVATLKALVARLEAQGIKVYLYALPTLAALERTRYVRTARLALADAFDGARWLHLDYPAAEMRWDDSIHFNDRSAIILACALERALNSRSGN
jgi:hypothetical protein